MIKKFNAERDYLNMEIKDLNTKCKQLKSVYIAHRGDVIDDALASFVNNVYPESEGIKLMFLR